ncbi:MAG: hypothetical protein U0T73_09160 [Chitinophagales bacterium]
MKAKIALFSALLILFVCGSCKRCTTCTKSGQPDQKFCNTNNQNANAYLIHIDDYKNLGYTCTEE